jgi:ethanolamine ammonia-lyase small subunit
VAGVGSRRDAALQAGEDVWKRLRNFTSARIGLGRVGASLPTQALLEFELAHARARDAVHAGFDAEMLGDELRESGFGEAVVVASHARNRMEYLQRPDLGRMLDEKSREKLGKLRCDLAVVIADGLSAVAPERHAAPLLRELANGAPGFSASVTVVVANYARVALGDEIGELLGAEAAVVLVGERPGLSSPDSLGVYLTWAPRVGRTDAERNCISNVRPEGLPYAEAARRLVYLLNEARRLKLSGVGLKDDSEGGAEGERESLSEKRLASSG